MAERAATALALSAVAAAYVTASRATFHFDDLHTVVANAAVHSWSAWAASLPAIRALTKASYVASHALSAAPWSYVLGGVALHLACTWLLLALGRRWLAVLAPRAPAGAAALAAALAFGLHPAQTEAVTYVAGRSVVLAAALYLAALLAYERARGGAPAMHALSLVAFALALAARETAWTLPFALVLLEVARGQRWREALRRAAPHAAVLAVALAAIGASPTYRRLLRESLATRGPLDNLYAQVEGVAYLVTHPLVTLRVNFDPDVAVPAAPDAGWWLAAAAIAATVAAGVTALRRAPWLGVALLWFLLHLAPTNGPIARYDLVNDRQLYLALAGPALAFGVVAARLAPRWRAAAVASVALALGVATALRNLDYASELALWEATVRASPAKSRAWNNLGWARQQAGDRDGAFLAYRRAVALDPANFRARANLEALGRSP